MAERPRTPPNCPPKRSETGQAAQAEREARLAEALRENLRKRKAQIRARGSDGAGRVAPADPDTHE